LYCITWSVDGENGISVLDTPKDNIDLSPLPHPFPTTPGATYAYLVVAFTLDATSFSSFDGFISNLPKNKDDVLTNKNEKTF